MKHSDFKIAMEFTTCEGERSWRVTDIGTRTILAIRLNETEIVEFNKLTQTRIERTLNHAEAEVEGWLSGPPYAVAEHVFDEYDINGCEPAK